MTILSVYGSPWHRHPQYLAYVAALQPNWIRHHQPQAYDVSEYQRVAPAAWLMLRSWDLDDHNGDRKRELYANPKAAARQLVEGWAEKAVALETELHSRNLPYDRSRWHFGAWNEPDPAYMPQIIEGTAEAMRLATAKGMRLGVVCASVGTFRKPDEPTPNWDAFKPLQTLINEGGHILIVHEYWQREGPAAVWVDEKGETRRDAGNLAWRHRSIPLDVPILIGEAGANGFIWQRVSPKDDCGWSDPRMGLSAEQYAAQVRAYIEGCDSRVQGVCLYMTDYHNDQWASFDTLPAHGALLKVASAKPQVAYPTVPTTPTQPASPYIAAPAGANVREGPDTAFRLLRTLRQGTAVQPVATNPAGTWLLLADMGWVHRDLVANAPSGLPVTQTSVYVPIVVGPGTPTQPAPALPIGILDPLVLEAILAVESGGRGLGNDGKPIIRFEAHVFKQQLGNDTAFNRLFRYGSPAWTGQEMFVNGDWWMIHTGQQESEWRAFELAAGLNLEAAAKSISMGAAQIMGFNHASIGYPTARAMLVAFRSEFAQMIAFLNFILGRPNLLQAVQARDWRTIASIYNGSGQVDYYAGLLEKTYNALKAAREN